jgi:hypothetical protein
MTREEWLALAERIEKATKPNREIDARISVAVGDVVMRLGKVTGKWAFWTTPVEPNQCATLSNVSGSEDDAFRALSEYTIASRYTGSLDIITALIERELPGSTRQSGFLSKEDAEEDDPPGGWARLFPPYSEQLYPKGDEDHERFLVSGCATEALARCAAFCRAMAERD